MPKLKKKSAQQKQKDDIKRKMEQRQCGQLPQEYRIPKTKYKGPNSTQTEESTSMKSSEQKQKDNIEGKRETKQCEQLPKEYGISNINQLPSEYRIPKTKLQGQTPLTQSEESASTAKYRRKYSQWYMAKKRQDKKFRNTEKVQETSIKRKKRLDTHYKQNEQIRERSWKKSKRTYDTNYRENEKRRDILSRKRKRSETNFRNNETTRESSHRKLKRTETNYKENETTRESSHRKLKRTETNYKENERRRDSSNRKLKRTETNYKENETTRESSHRKLKRTETNYKENERRRDSSNRKLKRTETNYKENEKTRESSHRKLKRTETNYKENETTRESSHRKLNRAQKTPSTVTKLIKRFHETVSEGPRYVCTSCKQLWYKHSVTEFSFENSQQELLLTHCPRVRSVKDSIWMCRTCKSHISKGKIPPTSVLNRMIFLDQEMLKDLNPLELTLLAVRLPFMKIYQAPRGKQKFISGNMVLVPADIQNTVTQLPRFTSNTSTIKAKLKRRLRYKHHVYCVNIRPELVRSAAQSLSKTPLYREHVTFNEQWDIENTVEEEIAEAQHESVTVNQEPTVPVQEEDNWSDDDSDELLSGLSDTLLSAQDFIEPEERDVVYNFAPGESSVPVSVFIDKDVEELAFPGIFCGHRRPTNNERPVRVTYGEIVKSELRNVDRRAARNVENIFFKAKKIQMKILIDQMHMVLRKIKTQNIKVTARDIKGAAIDNLVHHDKAYKALTSIRGSPPYFEKISKDLFAMIRSLGPATFFITLSAAETRWKHLLKVLGELVDSKVYSDEEIARLTWEEKCRLIQSDPVTCARHFDFAVSKFLNEFLLSNLHPVSEVEDFFYRVEYQHRGSPHIHMMIWCKDSPRFGETSNQDLCDFVDKYISCTMPEETSQKELVELQRHRHSHTCRKKRQKKCRFGFPKPILDRTMILEPLSPPEFTKEQITSHKATWKKVHDELNVLDESEHTNLEEFLSRLQLTEEQYICAIKASISKPTVFLKRSSTETRINNFNLPTLRAWRANIDIQFVLDVYACAVYIASYLTKSQRGMSELLRKATQEASEGNSDIRQQVKVVGNKFLNAVEISAQEAVYLCLQLPMKKASRKVVFVNTSPPEERVSLLKPRHILETMDDDDDDIECSSLISRYADRPSSMETITLAEFASFYEKKKDIPIIRSAKLSKKTVDCLLPEPNKSDNEDEEDNQSSELQNTTPDLSSIEKTGYRKRTKATIIRSVHFNPDVDLEKYYRELIMLYFPWRDEENLKQDCDTYSERYNHLKQTIEETRLNYEPFATVVDIAQQILDAEPDQENAWDELAPTTEDADAKDKERQTRPIDAGIEQYNIAGDIGLPISNTESDLHDYNEMPDNVYREHMRSLNQEQMEFVYDTIHLIKTSPEPIYRFLSGGAGVGKSFLTRALYQTALKYLNKQAGENFTTRRILLLAPTGKAAFHINGTTIHSGLKIAANQKVTHKPLHSSQLSSLRNEIGSIKLVFIDEISMVGFNMFNCIHQRLMEVMQSPKPFGGVSVIAVGDLFQIEPVFDSYIFKQPKNGLMPLATNLWTDLFSMFELQEIMRQADNKTFAQLLNRLREGMHTNDDLQILQQRKIKRDSPDYPYDATHLMYKNDIVNAYNHEIITKSPNPKFNLKARDRVVGSTSANMTETILTNFRRNNEKSCQLPNEVVICESINYDLTVNLNTKDGLTNGASCQLIKADIDKTVRHPNGILWVKFTESLTGASLRTESRKLYKRGYDKTWTPLQPVVKQFAAGRKGQAQVQRYQFPLRPNHAKTVHRSQGDTLEKAVLDLSLNRRVDHLHYVAVSRLQSLNGLHILNLQENKISVSSEVKTEMARLRNSPLELSHQFVYKSQDSFKLAFLNTRSLHKHLPDIRMDRNVLSADVVCFCETRFKLSDTYTNTAIDNFVQYRQDFEITTASQRSPYGQAVYSKSNFQAVPVSEGSDKISAVVFSVEQQADVIIVSVYRSPKESTKKLFELLHEIQKNYIDSSKAIIIGDFNVDWQVQSSEKTKLENLLVNTYHYKQVVTSSTNDYNSTIDLIFTNFDYACAGVCENYYSDHRLCWISW